MDTSLTSTSNHTSTSTVHYRILSFLILPPQNQVVPSNHCMLLSVLQSPYFILGVSRRDRADSSDSLAYGVHLAPKEGRQTSSTMYHKPAMRQLSLTETGKLRQEGRKQRDLKTEVELLWSRNQTQLTAALEKCRWRLVGNSSAIVNTLYL